MQKRIEELTQLPVGWDGYRGQPVAAETAAFAMLVLDTICGADAVEPQVVPGTTGDLQIEWHSALGDIELHIRGLGIIYLTEHKTMSDEKSQQEGLDVVITGQRVSHKVVEWVRGKLEPLAMRAKMLIVKIEQNIGDEVLHLKAIEGSRLNPENGDDAENTYASFKPFAEMKLTIENENLLGKFKAGEVYHLDFYKAER